MYKVWTLLKYKLLKGIFAKMSFLFSYLLSSKRKKLIKCYTLNMKKNSRDIVKIIFLFFICSMFQFSFAQSAKELEQSISDKNKELLNLEKKAEEIRNQIDGTQGKKNSLKKELDLINKERTSLENSISQTQVKISILDDEISSTKYEINEKKELIFLHKYSISELLRLIYRNDSQSLLELLFQRSNFFNLFFEKDNSKLLQPKIHKLTRELNIQNRELEKDRLELNKQNNELNIEKSKLNDQKSIVKEQEIKKEQVLSETKNQEKIYQNNLQKILLTIKKLDEEIRSFESKLQFILNKEALPKAGSEVFSWPLDYVLITQRFGKTTASGRLYKSGSHSGMDFRASVGTPVYAVADGVVKGVGDTDEICPKASFGKWVFVEHDAFKLSTTSGHLSKISVKEGQKIKEGQIIGYSGNTGRSTAPHLHLTVYATEGVNGEQGVRVTNRKSAACAGKTYRMPLAPTAAYLDPLDYLPKASQSMFKHPSLAQ